MTTVQAQHMHPIHNPQPPVGVQVAMAYAGSTQTPGSKPGQTRSWEELRKKARKIEGQVEQKLEHFSRSCSNLEAGYNMRADMAGKAETAHKEAKEIEVLLQQLSDVNDEMGASLQGGDGRQYTLARHREILTDKQHEFRRLNDSLGAARDRSDLLFGQNSSTPLMGIQVQGNNQLLLRERNTIASSTFAIDSVLGQANEVSNSLSSQRNLFDSIDERLSGLSRRFPVVNGLMNQIKRKRSRDTIILSIVIAVCIIVLVMYWYSK
eukprot:TRINITY_DN814_c0_g1_i5.p1 TRINITY_DN814_c0_g1~~TRINITY_DN814_c0_g1_i5.p1  ORF type:complete len:275 (-),score=26.16 TRINITY_DN814_c0_g1_i5:400-1194(-)